MPIVPDTGGLASLEDFKVRKAPDLAEESESMVEALLSDASSLILAEAALSDETWVTEQTDVPAVIVSICVEVAYRAWSNPDALAQSSMQDTSLSYVRGGTPDALFLTDAERRTIRRVATLSSAVEVTLVSPYSGDDVTEDEL